MKLQKLFKINRACDFYCNCQECNLEEVSDDEEAPAKSSKDSKSSKDKKANGPDAGKTPSLVFKITSRVPYKTVLKGIPQIFAALSF